MGRNSTVGLVDSPCVERGLASLISQNSVRFSLAFTGDVVAFSPTECTLTDFASWLRVYIGKLRPVPASRHVALSAFIFKDLANASHVLLRHGALRGALQVLYVGPCRLLHRRDKSYFVEVQGAARTVSIDLKTTYAVRKLYETGYGIKLEQNTLVLSVFYSKYIPSASIQRVA